MARLLFPDLATPSPEPAQFTDDWREYVRLPAHVLEQIDIVVLNLVCALGLPGAEVIYIPSCVAKVNSWVPVVKRWTDAAYQQYFLPDPGHYKNSVAFFRAVSLVNALQRRCGVVYDPARKGLGPDDPYDFDDYFIYSVIHGRGGTCATLPVVYAAVGRRLGYPIRLVPAKRHLFCRWDDPATGERFNMEGTNQGFDSHPDDHYRNWPAPISPDEERRYGFLRSLRPREELAHFVGGRAAFLEDQGRFREAAEAYAIASDLDCDHARYPWCLLNCLRQWRERIQARLPPRSHFPRYEVVTHQSLRRWPASVPWEVEKEFAALEGLDRILSDPAANRRWWQPLRERRPPLEPLPACLETHYPRESAGR